jgi:hypothetical protein
MLSTSFSWEPLSAAAERAVVGTGFAGGRAGGGLVAFVVGGAWGGVGGGAAAVTVVGAAALVVVVGPAVVVVVAIVGIVVGSTVAAMGSPEDRCGTRIRDTPVAASTIASATAIVRRRDSVAWGDNTAGRATGPPEALRPFSGSQDELRLS